MRRMLLALGLVAAAACLVFPAVADDHGATFTPIGFIDDPGPWPASLVFGMSGDGSMLVTSPSPWGGYCTLTDMDLNWTLVGSTASSCAISKDGTTVMSGYRTPEGYGMAATWAGVVDQWNPIAPPAGFEPCGSSGLSFFDMGGSGNYATGLTWEGCSGARAFHWDGYSNTSTNLGSINGDSSRGNGITDDGSHVVGWTRMPRGNWRGAEWVNGQWSWIDGLGDDLAFQVCEFSGNECGWDGDCAEEESCVGNLASEGYKGEAYRVTPDGQYTLGYNFGNSPYHWSDPNYDPSLWGSAWLRGPEGFEQIGPPPGGFPGDTWTPIAMSDDGSVVVGRYGWWIYSYPTIWTKWTGTMDFQLFLVQQGLDDLWFWYLSSLNAVSSDGTIVGGYGSNPEFWTEGFVVDISRVKACYYPPNDPENPRTVTIALKPGDGQVSVEDVLLGGGFIGTCEWADAGARERLNQLRPERQETVIPPDFNPVIPNANDVQQLRKTLGADPILGTFQPQSAVTTPERSERPAPRAKRTVKPSARQLR